ncbi:MAG: 16S rRNA (cytidine(1402)-2'-O)-methyltransferase [bacterium]
MLTIVPTPLGNLLDITAGSIEALNNADIILCEDTRRTARLSSHFGFKARLERYNEHNTRSLERALEFLRAGKKVALVSDGGTPCISDPGWKLVSAARSAGLKVLSLPGPCAAVAAAAGSGLPADSFVFLGFLPRSGQKIVRALETAALPGKTVILYESPFRIVSLLRTMAELFGADTPVTVAREMTKLHEEWLKGSVGQVLAVLSSRDGIKGEITVVFVPPKAKKTSVQETSRQESHRAQSL